MIKVFLDSGSHFLINADWGCSDGEHKAWMVVEVENKDQARQIVPPLYHQHAKITKLKKYSQRKIEESLKFQAD